MGPDRLQLQRLELKYIISEAKAQALRSFVSSFLELDEYGASTPDLGYSIHSLYLDSPDLRTYWDTVNGKKNRFKLRLRYYDEKPDSPVFFEIKRRMNEAILKRRGGVRREVVPDLLSGQMPRAAYLLGDGARALAALDNFSSLMLNLEARPQAHVSYRREAWVSTEDNSVRVTMDRDVRVAPESGLALGLETDGAVTPFAPKVILELKFTGRFPNWFRDLVEGFDLVRGTAAKYAEGVEQLGERHFGRAVKRESVRDPQGTEHHERDNAEIPTTDMRF